MVWLLLLCSLSDNFRCPPKISLQRCTLYFLLGIAGTWKPKAMIIPFLLLFIESNIETRLDNLECTVYFIVGCKSEPKENVRATKLAKDFLHYKRSINNSHAALGSNVKISSSFPYNMFQSDARMVTKKNILATTTTTRTITRKLRFTNS